MRRNGFKNGKDRMRGTAIANSAMNSPFGSASKPDLGVLVGLVDVITVMVTKLAIT